MGNFGSQFGQFWLSNSNNQTGVKLEGYKTRRPLIMLLTDSYTDAKSDILSRLDYLHYNSLNFEGLQKALTGYPLASILPVENI